MSLDGALLSPLPPDASLSYSVCMWGCLGTVTCRSTQQQAQLKEASLSGEINPVPVHVHRPALQAHLCVRGLAGAITGANTRSLSLAGHRRRRPPKKGWCKCCRCQCLQQTMSHLAWSPVIVVSCRCTKARFSSTHCIVSSWRFSGEML